MTPELSIVVVSWNTREALARCLHSVLTDPAGRAAETWVVDNASTDGSALMVARRFPSIQLIANGRNRGFAAACNQAVAQAGGEFVLLLNSDAAPEPGALRRLLEVLRTRPEVGVVGGQLLDGDGRPLRSYGRIPTVGAFVAEIFGIDRVPVLRRVAPTVASVPRRRERARAVGYVSGAFLAFRRELVDAVGPLDDRFFLYFEETDFCLRVRRDAGRLVWFEPAARARHEGQASAGQIKAEAEERYARSAYAFVRKHYGPAAVLRLSIAFRPWLAFHAARHRLRVLARRPGAPEAFARHQRLRALHRSLGRLGSHQLCPCRVSSSRPVRIGRGRGLRCEECGLLARAELPAAARLDRWYREGYWRHDAAEQLGPARAGVQRHALRVLESFASDPDTLVDVGCGAGGLLALCRESGWRGIGFEPSRQALTHARSKGLEVHGRPWPCSALADGSVGAVTFVNSLDHLCDPFSALREAWRVLRPGGLLYVRVPNGPLHARLMTALAPVGLAQLPVLHLFGFGRRSLRHHLVRLGFGVLALRSAPPAGGAACPGISPVRRLLARANAGLYRLVAVCGLDRRALGTSIEVVAVKDLRLGGWAGTASDHASQGREPLPSMASDARRTA